MDHWNVFGGSLDNLCDGHTLLTGRFRCSAVTIGPVMDPCRGLWSTFVSHCVHYIYTPHISSTILYLYVYVCTAYIYILLLMIIYIYMPYSRTHTEICVCIYIYMYLYIYTHTTFKLTPTNTYSSPRRLPDRRKFLAVPGLLPRGSGEVRAPQKVPLFLLDIPHWQHLTARVLLVASTTSEAVFGCFRMEAFSPEGTVTLRILASRWQQSCGLDATLTTIWMLPSPLQRRGNGTPETLRKPRSWTSKSWKIHLESHQRIGDFSLPQWVLHRSTRPHSGSGSLLIAMYRRLAARKVDSEAEQSGEKHPPERRGRWLDMGRCRSIFWWFALVTSLMVKSCSIIMFSG